MVEMKERPNKILALDLYKVATLIGCTEDDLLRGIHNKVDHSEIPLDPMQISKVLLTAASRPSCLDKFNVPKCLITLGGESILCHILRQLYNAGMQHVVISVAYGAKRIMDTVKNHPMYRCMHIEFLDLGEDNREGHARSILAAKHLFSEPFLLHTSDHIFDVSIIREMSLWKTTSGNVCILVEENLKAKSGLPSTTVQVQLDPRLGTVTKIGRKLEKFDGIDAGLFVCKLSVFDALEQLAQTKQYFSLAEALNLFALDSTLVFLSTKNRIWFSIETEEQLAYTRDASGSTVLSPWTVFLSLHAQTPSTSSSLPLRTGPHSQFLHEPSSMDAASHTKTTLRVTGQKKIMDSDIFGGFVVGVGHLCSSRETKAINIPKKKLYNSEGVGNMEISMPLMGMSKGEQHYESFGTTDAHKKQTQSISPILRNRQDPYDLQPENQNHHHQAYLFEVETQGNHCLDQQYVLAYPGKEPEDDKPSLVERITTLPSDVTNIKLETIGQEKDLGIQIVVERRVPTIGYIVLIVSLLTISSVGPALALQNEVGAIMKLVWRMMATYLILSPLVVYSIWTKGFPSLEKLDFVLLAGISMSYTYYIVTFIYALEYTSIGHAFLFSNSHSLIIVILKVLSGSAVVILEIVGAIVGILSGIVCTLDHHPVESHSVAVSASAFGDIIAFSGAVGGVGYLFGAKKYRPRIDVVTFLFLMTLMGSFYLLFSLTSLGYPVTLDMNRSTGIFGWMGFAMDRLPLELYLVLVCNCIGTMGYIAVMKYFDPLVVSVVMLIEPVLASLMGMLVGVEGVPGLLSLVGGTGVIIGTTIVIISSKEKKDAIDASTAICRAPVTAESMSAREMSANALLSSPFRMNQNLAS